MKKLLVEPETTIVQMTHNQFVAFCARIPPESFPYKYEHTVEGYVIQLMPNTLKGSIRHGDIYSELKDWNRKKKLGIVFDSAAGYHLSDNSTLSPDASWMTLEKWNSLTENEKDQFSPICPDFVVEIRSKHDSPQTMLKQNDTMDGKRHPPRLVF